MTNKKLYDIIITEKEKEIKTMAQIWDRFYAEHADHEFKMNLSTMQVLDLTTDTLYRLGYEFGTLYVKGVQE